MPRTSAAQRSQQAPKSLEPSADGIPAVSPSDILGYDGQVKGSAVTDEDLENKGPPVERWEVVKGGTVQTAVNGQRARLVNGKVIDSLNYDIPLIRRQGIELRAVVNTSFASTDDES